MRCLVSNPDPNTEEDGRHEREGSILMAVAMACSIDRVLVRAIGLGEIKAWALAGSSWDEHDTALGS